MPEVASSSTVRRIRQMVKDFKEPFKYDFDIYCDQVQFALEKLSYDFAETYLFDTDVPHARRFLLIKLAAIQMCYIRASDAADTKETDVDTAGDGGDITMVTVPGLQVQEGAESTGADHWLKLAADLQTEYDNEVYADGTSPNAPDDLGPEVQVGQMFRTDKRTGIRAPYQLDGGVAAPADLTVTLDGTDVVVAWTPVKDMHFGWYEIYRALDPDTLDVPKQSQRVDTISDPHGKMIDGIIFPRVVFSNLDPGTYHFKMATVSNSTLRNFTSTVSIVVP